MAVSSIIFERYRSKNADVHTPFQGVQGQSPWWGSEAKPPLKLTAFLFLRVQRKLQICPIIDIWKSANHTV